jgi:integrase
MTALRLKYVQSFTVDGVPFHYFRRKGSPRVRLPGMVGSSEFNKAYEACLAAQPLPVGVGRTKQGSVALAIADYFGSAAFRSLSRGTAGSRRCILEKFREGRPGDLMLAAMPKEFVVALLDTMQPHAARNLVKALRGLMKWAAERKLVREDVTQGIKVKLLRSDGYYTWSEDDIAAFESAHPVGTQARLAMALALYTSQRRSDVIRMGPQHIKNGVLSVRQKKTGTALAIPVHPELAEIIKATPCGHLTFLSKNGKPYGGEYFSQVFGRWCDEAKLPAECSIHGLRKAACTRLADAGCTAHEIAAISGHKTLAEVERYTRKADQARLARAALERLGNTSVKTDPGEVSKPLNPLLKITG